MGTGYVLFEYLYRDAGNYKAFGSVAFDGVLSGVELEVARSRFRDDDGFFIAEQVGVPALYRQLYEYNGGATHDDHCWHEFLDITPVSEAGLPSGVIRGGKAKDFLARLLAVREWEEQLSPHFPLDDMAHIAH